MKHTQGEWKVEKENNGKDLIITNEKRKIAKIIWYGMKFDEFEEANAHLIAEAGTITNKTGLTPKQLAEQRKELLEACKNLLEVFIKPHNETLNEVLEAKQAIAKAEGK